MARKKWLFLLIAIVVLGTALRFYKLASLSLWFDEGGTIHTSTLVDKDLSFILANISAEPPLFLLFVRFWYALTRALPGIADGSIVDDFLIRFPVCIAGILGIPLTFIACRSILKENETALIAALLFAISPFQIYYAQEFRPYSTYVVLSLGALFCLVKALEEDRVRYWVGLVAFLAASLYVHFFAIWNIALVNLYFVLTLNWHKKLLRKWLISQSVLALVCVPALILISQANSFYEQATDYFFLLPSLKTGIITFKTFFAGYSPNHLLYRAIAIVCAALSVLGLCALIGKRKTFALLFVMAFGAVAANIILCQIRNNPYYSHRLMIFSAVPCYMLVAYGIRAPKKQAFTLIAVALLTGLTVPCLADHYAQRLHPDWAHRAGPRYKVEARAAARYIAEQLADGDFVRHTSHFTLGSFWHYLPAEQQGTLGFTKEEREGIIKGYPNERMWEWSGVLPSRIESVVQKAKRLWLVQSWWEPFDLDPLSKQLQGWLDGHSFREERKPFDGLTVYLYKNDPELRAATKTCQLADYGDPSVPYYLFPKNESGLSAGREWRRRFLATFLSSSDRAPPLYGVQFDLAVAHDGELFIRGQRLSAGFLDEDGDGKRETLSLTDVGGLLQEEGTTAIESVDYSLLAMDGDGERAVLASFPLRTSNDFTYRFIVRNATDVARTVQWSVHESAHVIEPLSFDRSDPESDVWRPSLQYNFRPPPRHFNKFAMVARLTDKSPGGDAIHDDVRLDAGHYAVLARILEEAQPINRSRINLRFTVIPSASSGQESDGRLIGTLRGNNPSGKSGWTWRRVGDFRCDGEPFRLVVAAYNDDNVPKAYFDLGRVMFVRAEEHTSSSPVETERFDVTLLPFEEKTYTVAASLGEYQSKRIDIELFDKESKESRNIFFHVSREGYPENLFSGP